MRDYIRIIVLSGVLLGLICLASACAQQQDPPEAAPEAAKVSANPQVNSAVAVLHATEGNEVRGVVTFTRVENGIKIVADVMGLKPGAHGFHVHELGDCSAADGTSAGGHFNPAGVPHAGPDDQKRHVGDLGNIVADSDGTAHYERVDMHITFDGENSIIGRGLIVHAGHDDLTSQPTGAAGARVACAVIGVGK